MKAKLQAAFNLLKETFQEWNEDRAPRLAAALAFFTTFSLAPFLIVSIAIAGLIFDRAAVQGHLSEQIQGLLGAEGAVLVEQMMANIQERPSDNVVAGLIGLVTLLIGAGGVFAALQDALNTVWNVQPPPDRGLLRTLLDRFLSSAMVMGVGFLLLVSLLINTALAAAHTYLLTLFPGAPFLLQLLNFVVSFGVITVVFAVIYKVLPHARIEWRDVWVGAAFTALLFSIGRFALGLYLGSSGIASVYGAAGALVLILFWIFYSAQIVLFGAEFTQVYARHYGSRIRSSGKQAEGEPTDRVIPAQQRDIPEPALTQNGSGRVDL